MKNSIVLILAFFTGTFSYTSQEVYKATAVNIDFFSSAPIEDIQAKTNRGISVLKPSTGEISFLLNIRDLTFPKGLMQEHFNENFMESDRFPTATFKGKIVESVDFSLPGKKPVLLSGTLEIHGIRQQREIPAVLFIENNQINLESRFDVACKDHNIKIPKILWKNIAEVVQVQVYAKYKL